MLVVGDKEIESGSVSVRHHGAGDLGAMEVSGLTARMHGEVGD
jgi:threonyl-tRNA synthetase